MRKERNDLRFDWSHEIQSLAFVPSCGVGATLRNQPTKTALAFGLVFVYTMHEHARVVHWSERLSDKEEAEGSIPSTRTAEVRPVIRRGSSRMTGRLLPYPP